MTSAVAPASLSVVIPTYNRAEYVRTCLTTLRESGIPDLDVIVSDDGSTDDTKQVVAETNPTARYLWQPNRGTPSAPRNAGYAVSRGRYVCFLDCDDRWLPQVPARAVELLDKYPQIDVLFADAKVGHDMTGFRSWIDVAGQDDFHKLPRTELEPGFYELARESFFRRMVVRNAVFAGSCVVRREVFDQFGGFDTSYWGAEDWELWTRMAHRHRFGFLADPMAVYLWHDTNVTKNTDKMVSAFIQALRNVRAKCDLSPADRQLVSDRLRHHLFHHAYLAYDSARYPDARRRFAASVWAGDLSPRTLAYGLTCLLPGPVVSRLRRLKQGA